MSHATGGRHSNGSHDGKGGFRPKKFAGVLAPKQKRHLPSSPQPFAPGFRQLFTALYGVANETSSVKLWLGPTQYRSSLERCCTPRANAKGTKNPAISRPARDAGTTA